MDYPLLMDLLALVASLAIIAGCGLAIYQTVAIVREERRWSQRRRDRVL